MRKIPVYLLFVFLLSCNSSEQQVTFPYSQWTVGPSGHHLNWHYPSGLEMNHSFIRQAGAEEWNEWYSELLKFREEVSSKIGREAPMIRLNLEKSGHARIHFDKIGYDQKLRPGEIISFEATLINGQGKYRLFATYDLKSRGEERSYVVRKSLSGPDTLDLETNGNPVKVELQTEVPYFEKEAYSISPILWIEAAGDNDSLSYLDLYGIRLSIPGNAKRQSYLRKVREMIKSQARNNSLQVPETFDWMHDNFVMGFAFTWDSDFWNPEKGEYTIDKYCEKMEREFGGIQSVILWHSYPNIGIDDRNQFDMFEAMPGGIEGLRGVTRDFHRHGVKVFITYNPWDLDTRRPSRSDNRELARIVSEINADGIYLDTWKSSCGIISIFSANQFMRQAVQEAGENVAFSTEIHPEYKDLVGNNALTCSWGQEIAPYNYTDLSLVKWIMPQHKQHYIKRMNKDRTRELTHAWINGQGIQVWENIFGTMNPWKAGDRKVLRKMNNIWQAYGRLYLSENWLPLLPMEGSKGLMSVWTVGDRRIINIVNTSGDETATISLQEEMSDSLYYFDLWSGRQLYPEGTDGTVSFQVDDFGCLLIAGTPPADIEQVMERQRQEDKRKTPVENNDPHTRENQIKYPVTHSYDQHTAPREIGTGFLEIAAGNYTLHTRHIWREGHCYPDPGARDNHDLNISGEDGVQWINHTHEASMPGYRIMPGVVTNRQFGEFLESSGYTPEFQTNFLDHWVDDVCPDSLLDQPVVYVSLEDARAFAAWAGMRLPTEWQWQLAWETHGDDFRINEVFEWNESERYDGHNRFVTLRGGCSSWTMPSSWWYLPGAPRGETVGGPQTYDSHVKYFLMYPGLDRAKTIGFRCMKY